MTGRLSVEQANGADYTVSRTSLGVASTLPDAYLHPRYQEETSSTVTYPPTDPRPINVLVAPSAVAGVNAAQAAQTLGEGIRSVILDADISLAPISAGGQGTATLFAGEDITLPTTDAAGNLTEATYTFDSSSRTAYIDAADATGTTELSPGSADSYGIGVLAADAASRGAQRVVLALGDSVADDGGVGILVALGIHPLDSAGRTLPKGGQSLQQLADFDTAKLNVAGSAMEWVLITDTDGGLDSSAPGMTQLAEVTGVDPATPGMGAGKGLGMALTWISTVIHGSAEKVRLIPGTELIAEALDVSALAGQSSFIVTAGATAAAFAQAVSEDTVLGVVGSQAPESAATVVSAELTGDHGEALRTAGAQLAADYLTISTSQG